MPISLSVRFPFVQAGTVHIRPYDIAAGSLRSARVGTSVRRHRGGDESHYCIFACPSHWGAHVTVGCKMGSRSAHHPDLHRRVAPGAATSRSRIRDDRRSFCPSHAPSLSRAPLRLARDQGEVVAPSVVSRCRPERLWRSLCDLPTARAAAARCRPYHHGCERAARTTDRLERPAVNRPPRGPSPSNVA
jgi:hypothetical protein